MGWRRRQRRPLTRSQKLKRWYRNRFPMIVVGLCLTAFIVIGGFFLITHFPDQALPDEERIAASE